MSISPSDIGAIDAHYYDGRSSRRQAARLRLSGGRLYLAGDWGLREAPLATVEISEPMGSAPRTLRFGDGAYCEVADQNGFAAMLAAAGHREPLSVRLHARWGIVLGALGGVLFAVVATYLWLLPALADYMAPRLPAALVSAVSQATLDSLDRHVLQPSTLPPQRQLEVRRRMQAFAAAAGLPPYRLHFRDAGKDLPPNAFALPDGDIVIFDSLLQTLDDDEALAVFAHELGHVAHHHGMRMLIQNAVVSSAVAIYLGDISSLVAGLSAAMLQANYSQDFESEADRYAATALQRNDRSPLLLASALEKLQAAARAQRRAAAAKAAGKTAETAPVPNAEDKTGKAAKPAPTDTPATQEPGWLARRFASHPSVAQRIAALKALAQTAGPVGAGGTGSSGGAD